MKATTKGDITKELKQLRATVTKLTAALSEADKSKADLTSVLESVTMADGELLIALRDLQAAKRTKGRSKRTVKADKPKKAH